MADVYMYADETGDLDFEGTHGSTKYFGVGTVTFREPHPQHLWHGQALRAALERRHVHTESGFQVHEDSPRTRTEVFELIKQQAPQVDARFYLKAKAYSDVLDKGIGYVYKLAWHLHLREVLWRTSSAGDTVYFVAATFGTKARRSAAWSAITGAWASLFDVAVFQRPKDREVVLCHWDSGTSWGLQVADYALWAAQRSVEHSDPSWLPYIDQALTIERPWD